MASVSSVFSKFMEMLELPVNQNGLGISVILGYPVVGRKTPTLPLGAVVFLSDDYSRSSGGQGVVRSTIGRVPPAGEQFAGRLSLFAKDERSLLELVDRLRTVKATKAGLVVGSEKWTVRYGATERGEFAPEEDVIFNHMASTPFWLILNQ